MRTYRANLFVVFLAVVIPGGFFAAAAGEIFFKKKLLDRASFLFVAGLLLAWMCVLAYLFALRVEVGIDSITYRNLFNGQVVIPFSELSSTVLEKGEGSESTTYILIVTPRVHSGKRIIKIPLYLLSFSAGVELASLLRAKERNSNDLLTIS
jgi:hypothetical protein